MSMYEDAVFFDRNGESIEQNFGFRARFPVSVDIFDDGKTVQSERDNCDINKIIQRFDRTGVLPAARAEPRYADVTKLNGYYQDVLDQAQSDIDTANQFIAEKEAEIAAAKLAAEEAEAAVTDQPKASVSAQTSDS